MAENSFEAFGFDPEDFGRAMQEAGDGLRSAFERWAGSFAASGDRGGLAAFLSDLMRAGSGEPQTAGESGDGVWAIYTVSDTGDARVEQVFPTEIEALRANRHNTDPKRNVRFLPYGIAVGVLDGDDEGADPRS